MEYVNLLNTKKASQSTSATNTSLSITVDQVGICPKCSKTMSTATIQSGEDAYYCESCRVALPKPNKVGS